MKQMKTACSRKYLSVIMTLAMIVSLLGGMTISANAASTAWEGGVATGYAGGTGTSGDPYEIHTAEQLAYLAQEVNAGTSYLGKYFILTDDIFLNSNTDPSEYTWPAIGKQGAAFAGTFDGGGHYICNIYIFNTSGFTHKGLFGSTDPTAVVKNLGVTGTVGAYRYASGIVGYNTGTIENCFSAVTVTGNDSGSRGSGGIAGVNDGTIRNCYNAGTVHNLYRPAGGIAGINYTSSALIENCYSIGEITSAGGTGFAGAITATQNGSTITNCYYLTGSATSAVAYQNNASLITAFQKTASELQAGTFPAALSSSFKADPGGYNNGYPVLTWQNSPIPTNPGTPDFNVTFTTTGAAPIATMQETDGSVTFAVSPTVTGAAITGITFAADSGAYMTKNAANSYTISNISSDLAVAVNVSSSASYSTTNAVSGIIDITTASPVTISGNSVQNVNLLIDGTAQATDLTIEDLNINNAFPSVIDFATGSNTLTVAGECILEETGDSNAAIHVPAAATLDMLGNGTLYLYKSSLAAGIGASVSEANGAITIDMAGGSLFAKGTRTGPVIGNDAGTSGGLGVIHLVSGDIFVVTVSQGAGIGGSRMSNAGSVIVEKDVNLTLAVNFSGSAIGAGANKRSGGNNGTLTVNGGSIKTMITSNAYSSWGITAPSPDPGYVVNDTAITAAIKNSAAVPLYLCVLPGVTGTNTVIINSHPSFTVKTHDYIFTNTTTTVDNFIPVVDPNVYLYLKEADYEISVNGVDYTAEWNGGGFDVYPA